MPIDKSTIQARMRLLADQAEIADNAESEFSHDMNVAADMLDAVLAIHVQASPQTDPYGCAQCNRAARGPCVVCRTAWPCKTVAAITT